MSTTRKPYRAPSAKLGRPRATPDAGGGEDPREEILEAAARLFASAGYRQTSTKQIADAVGLRQASLFYYFAKKEDMLRVLLDRTVAASIEFVDRLGSVDARPDVLLYALVYRDLMTLYSPPGNLGRLMFQPEARTGRFNGFWAQHTKLLNAYRDLVRAGAAQGLLNVGDPKRATRILFGLVEGAATWDESPSDATDQELWTAISDFALRALLVRPGRVAEVRRKAMRVVIDLDDMTTPA